jgi:hypothetical protein
VDKPPFIIITETADRIKKTAVIIFIGVRFTMMLLRTVRSNAHPIRSSRLNDKTSTRDIQKIILGIGCKSAEYREGFSRKSEELSAIPG